MPDVWSRLLGRGLRFLPRRRTRNSVWSETPIVHGRTELPNTSSQANLTEAVWGKLIPTILALVMGMNAKKMSALF